MPRTTNRREAICAAAIDVLADGGGNALSHQAIDRRLEFPAGSTSYYYRTRRALVIATVEHLADRSRTAFLTAQPERVESVAAASGFMASQLADLIRGRRPDALARYALMIETGPDAEVADLLAACFFSHDKARALFEMLGHPGPDAASADLIALLEGLVFDYVCGRRRRDAAKASLGALCAELEVPIRALVSGR